ncbi:hypothetical protein [Pseudoxanthomonas broegbernensis]|uniref:hypothetical protein n=1 Tax=Pseudoxanthomonas broegbernensis TaxID=83619 RepID=UPI0013919E43|nr:hypothetical protein [Pseudoxanthomonas broegbernensis]MBB6065219.1 hypothetical protein [Pseudoxanthomonas broegbernensis]
MNQEKRSPREAGIGRKLAGWAHRNSTLLHWLPMLGPLAFVAALVAHAIWEGAR